uniref:Uncharacterized protein n=1 Tax=Panagrolaimus sp. ES5 TaxID=591445 RepID=A0AC34GQE3_9BILA
MSQSSSSQEPVISSQSVVMEEADDRSSLASTPPTSRHNTSSNPMLVDNISDTSINSSQDSRKDGDIEMQNNTGEDVDDFTNSQRDLLTYDFFENLCATGERHYDPVLGVLSSAEINGNDDFCMMLQATDGSTTFGSLIVKKLEKQALFDFKGISKDDKLPIIKLLDYECQKDETRGYPEIIIHDYISVVRSTSDVVSKTPSGTRIKVPEMDIPKMPNNSQYYVPLSVLHPHIRGPDGKPTRWLTGVIFTHIGTLFESSYGGTTLIWNASDRDGNMVGVTAHGKIAESAAKKIHENCCYYLSDIGGISISKPGQNSLGIHITLTSNALIIPTKAELAQSPELRPVPLSKILGKRTNDRVDIYAVVHRIEPVRQVLNYFFLKQNYM